MEWRLPLTHSAITWNDGVDKELVQRCPRLVTLVLGDCYFSINNTTLEILEHKEHEEYTKSTKSFHRTEFLCVLRVAS
jgi:hypothetical protein